MNSQKKVVVGLSGGVDSSLTAALLQEQGYFVIGVYMKNWSTPIKGVEHCPWIQDELDARRVAAQLGIPFYTVNFEKEYKQHVVDTFLADYDAGRTPNPDVLCNQFIKFDHFLNYAKSLGADYIATGHYARVEQMSEQRSEIGPQAEDCNLKAETYALLLGIDSKKDQTYFLWAINREALPFVLMPLGGMTKVQVREEAQKRGLLTAKKKDSQGICFIGQADVRDFLRGHFTDHPGYKPGNVLSLNGEIVGKHEGAGFYTIGQKAGLDNIKTTDMTNRPIYYVITTDINANTITVGEETELYSSMLIAGKANWLSDLPQTGQKLLARIRHGQQLQSCVMVNPGSNGFELTFDIPQRAITPGQSVVVYDGDVVVGGGIIS